MLVDPRFARVGHFGGAKPSLGPLSEQISLVGDTGPKPATQQEPLYGG